MLEDWASTNDLTIVWDPKESASFQAPERDMASNPDLTFVSAEIARLWPTRKVLEKFPRSRHRPSVIASTFLVTPIEAKPLYRWNFRKVDWENFAKLLMLEFSIWHLRIHQPI